MSDGLRVSAEVDPEDLQRRLRGYAVEMLDLRPFWAGDGRRIGREWLRQHFASEGSWGGDPWAPIAPSTWMTKPAGSPILVHKGKLKRAVSAPRSTIGPMSMELRINNPIVHFHEFGTKKMPARPVIPRRIPGSAIDQLRKAFEDHADTVKAKWGL